MWLLVRVNCLDKIFNRSEIVCSSWHLLRDKLQFSFLGGNFGHERGRFPSLHHSTIICHQSSVMITAPAVSPALQLEDDSQHFHPMPGKSLVAWALSVNTSYERPWRWSIQTKIATVYFLLFKLEITLLEYTIFGCMNINVKLLVNLICFWKLIRYSYK